MIGSSNERQSRLFSLFTCFSFIKQPLYKIFHFFSSDRRACRTKARAKKKARARARARVVISACNTLVVYGVGNQDRVVAAVSSVRKFNCPQCISVNIGWERCCITCGYQKGNTQPCMLCKLVALHCTQPRKQNRQSVGGGGNKKEAKGVRVG